MRKRRASGSDDLDSDYNHASGSDYAPEPATRATKRGPTPGRKPSRKKTKHDPDKVTTVVNETPSLHPGSTHVIRNPAPLRSSLLKWYNGVHDSRDMPWRKPYDPSLGPDDRGQRAYEVWVSEIMLQQTQVATVVPYYNRWIEKFPTIRDLAGSTIDEVNSLWKGLGYYSRASRLLAGAQRAVQQYAGKLPDNARDMEANIPGIGRYSAGAICSIAYGESVPVLDGNVHRLLSRVLALHAAPKAKKTLDILWAAATAMVETQTSAGTLPPGSLGSDETEDTVGTIQYAGDINQALIELGSTVCKVRDPNSYAATSTSVYSKKPDMATISDIEDACSICEPVPEGSTVTVYPMKSKRKKAREEMDLVNVIEWRSSSGERWFLLVRRPDSGLLAGLHDFPTASDVSKSLTRANATEIPNELVSTLLQRRVLPYRPGNRKSMSVNRKPDENDDVLEIAKILPAGDIVHVFSHVKKTYRAQWVVLEGGDRPPDLLPGAQAEKRHVMDDEKGKRTRNKRQGNGTSTISNPDRPVSAVWAPLDEVADANLGTGLVKVWNLVKRLWEEDVNGA